MTTTKWIILAFILIVLKLNNGNENGLNMVEYSRVLNDIKPLIPKKEKSESMKYSENKLVLFIDKECSNNNYINNNKNHIKLFKHLLNRYNNCIYMINNEFGDNGDGIYSSHNDWFTFIKLNDTIKCLNNNIINYRHYCISNFRYSRIYSINSINTPKCSKNTDTSQYDH